MIDWERVHKAFEFGTCQHWKTCGTHCCNSRIIFKHFEWLGKGCMTALPMSESEAAFLRANRTYQKNFPGGEFTLPFEVHGTPLTLVLAKCNQDGVCADQPYRPLICKLYPYLPAYDKDGTCRGVVGASVFDLFWEHLDEKDPCEVKRLETRAQFREKFTRAALPLAKEPWWPELRWWFNTGAAFLENVRTTTLAKLPGRRTPAAFFPEFEKLYLSGEGYDLERFRQEVEPWPG